MKVYVTLVMLIGILFFMTGCHENKVDKPTIIRFDLTTSDSEHLYHVDVINIEESIIHDILIPSSGNYRILKEEHMFRGKGEIITQYNENNAVIVWLYVNPVCYPIVCEMSWKSLNGKINRKNMILNERDMPIKWELDQVESAGICYMFCLHSDGRTEIIKKYNGTHEGALKSKDMKIK